VDNSVLDQYLSSYSSRILVFTYKTTCFCNLNNAAVQTLKVRPSKQIVKNTLANRWGEQKVNRKAKKKGEEIVSYWTSLRELHNYCVFKKVYNCKVKSSVLMIHSRLKIM
jgi:hypothetical protein